MIGLVRPKAGLARLSQLHGLTAFHHDGTMNTMDTMNGPFESRQATDNTENTDPDPCAVPLTRGLATVVDSTTIRAARGGQRDDPCHPWETDPPPLPMNS